MSAFRMIALNIQSAGQLVQKDFGTWPLVCPSEKDMRDVTTFTLDHIRNSNICDSSP